MNPIETIVTDLETSRAMHEAGIDFGKTVFVWVRDSDNTNEWHLVLSKSKILKTLCKIIPAYTAGEMMQGLPEKIGKHYFGLAKKIDLYFAFYGEDRDFIISFFNKLPHQALSKLCLWCKKEGYL